MRGGRVWLLCAALAFWAGGPTQGLAQQAQASVTDPILENQRRRDLEERINALGTLEPRGGAPDPGPAQAAGGPCFPINEITVEGATLLSPQEVQAIVDPYVRRCLQGADIQAMMRLLDAAYAERGYITSKTYIPPQNLQAGTLILTMLEGRVEDILFIDTEQQLEGPRTERQIATAFPNARGALFQLRDFEQGLDQMNRLASVEAVLKLQPGEEAGGSYAVVQRVQTDPNRAWLRWDNQGAAATGRNKLSFDLEFDDLIGANDAWTVGYSGSDNTNALSVTGSVPWGYWTFSGDLGYSEYLTPLTARTELFGTSRSWGLKARVMADRDQTSTTELDFALQARKSDRYINNVRLTPQNLTTLSLGVRHMRLGQGGRNSYDARLTFGTGLFGADRDPEGLGRDVPHAQFAKLEAGWQRQGALANLGTLVTDLRGQVTGKPLYGAEQLSLGSLSTVRGYDASIATGDRGAYMRNDLYLTPAIWSFLPPGAADVMAAKAQAHVFVDFGATWDIARDVRETAAGYGVGLSYYHDAFTLSGVVGLPLVERAGVAEKGSAVVQLRVDVKAW